MKLKLKSALVMIGVFAAVLGVGMGHASAAPFLAHNAPITVKQGNCKVTFQHGNVYGGAYSKFKLQPGAYCTAGTYTQVTGYSTGMVNGNVCGPVYSWSGCANTGDGWFQSIVGPPNNLLGSKVQVCDVTLACNYQEYSGVF